MVKKGLDYFMNWLPFVLMIIGFIYFLPQITHDRSLMENCSLKMLCESGQLPQESMYRLCGSQIRNFTINFSTQT